MLKRVHPENHSIVFSVIDAAEKAVCLPASLFNKWISSIAPAIDLRGVALNPAQWCTLTAAILHTAAGAVTSLHLEATSKLKPVADSFKLMENFGSQTLTCTKSTCRAGENKVIPVTGKLKATSSGECPTCREVLTSTRRCDYSVQQIRKEMSNLLVFDQMQMLAAAQGVVPHTSCLEVLGFHNLHLTPQLIPAFEQLVDSLPASLTQLHLSTCKASDFKFGVQERTLFFKAVAQVRNLRELHMAQWEAFVGSDASICAEPLQFMPGLRIFVPTLKQTAAFPSGLAFQATESTP